ncbi:MAG: hypothetical protein KJ550_13725 [Proteobacteria bacterium]|nr:hypothetical protein [Desulfobacteraceae bacterium]MBU2520871.1 hypothetical protein [Pseudomonadota bacterium]MBU4014505.1 hypothetical protein [Pseudomonadota bacterium]MBU4066720.1 hypothetical protein [Pseudomonadota bacterium]MBU4101595.1 hypothetical protein [Pseudomonadota bacterium]
MSFKENLLKKIKIDKMSKIVLNSIGSPDSGKKIDKETMRELLEMSPYKFRKERDLDLYIKGAEEGIEKILVLDNDLAIYKTTVEDVGMRKTPTVKEMLNIGNIIKILNDKDVVISKKGESLRTVQNELIEMIDLSFNKSDIEEIEKDGLDALEKWDADGVSECLSLFAELLGYRSPPKVMKIINHSVMGSLTKKESGEVMFGPVVIYSTTNNYLKLIDEQIGSLDKEKIELMHHIAVGKEAAPFEGPLVLQYLKEEVLKRNF